MTCSCHDLGAAFHPLLANMTFVLFILGLNCWGGVGGNKRQINRKTTVICVLRKSFFTFLFYSFNGFSINNVACLYFTKKVSEENKEILILNNDGYFIPTFFIVNEFFNPVICVLTQYSLQDNIFTVLPAKSNSDVMFCLLSHQGLIIDRSRFDSRSLKMIVQVNVILNTCKQNITSLSLLVGTTVPKNHLYEALMVIYMKCQDVFLIDNIYFYTSNGNHIMCRHMYHL